MKLNPEIKDWQIAREMWGKNKKEECRKVKELRKHGVITPLCDDWSIITDERIEDDCGWLVPNLVLI